MTKTAQPSQPKLSAFARHCLFAPTTAAEDARKPGAIVPGLWLYAAFILATAAFYAWKPFDFPDANASFPRETQNLAFWLKVMIWQPPLEAAWIVLLIALLGWFEKGKLFPRLLGAVVATAAPFVLLILYKQSSVSWSVYFALAVTLGALAVWRARAVPLEQWRPIAALMLALNVVGLLMVVPMTLAVFLSAPPLFTGAQIAGGLWVLGCGTLGLRALTGQRLPRCFMSVLLSLFMQIAFAFTLHMLGLVPKDILKALLLA